PTIRRKADSSAAIPGRAGKRTPSIGAGISLTPKRKKSGPHRVTPRLVRPFTFVSRDLQFDLSRSCSFCLWQDELQDAVLEGRLDAVSVDVFRQCENAFVIPIGVLVVNPLVPRMLVGGAVSADPQDPTFEADVDPFGGNSGHLRQYDDAVFCF